MKFNGNAKSEDDFQGTPNKPKPGKYHAQVIHADESGVSEDPEVRAQSRTQGKVVVGFAVLAGTLPGQEGTELREYFFATEKAMPRLEKLAYVLELLKPGDQNVDVSFANALGKDLIIEVEANPYQKKKDGVPQVDGNGNPIMNDGIGLSFYGMWSLGHRDVKDVPRGTPKPIEEVRNAAASNGQASSQQDSGQATGQTAAASQGNAAWDDVEL